MSFCTLALLDSHLGLSAGSSALGSALSLPLPPPLRVQLSPSHQITQASSYWLILTPHSPPLTRQGRREQLCGSLAGGMDRFSLPQLPAQRRDEGVYYF